MNGVEEVVKRPANSCCRHSAFSTQPSSPASIASTIVMRCWLDTAAPDYPACGVRLNRLFVIRDDDDMMHVIPGQRIGRGICLGRRSCQSVCFPALDFPQAHDIGDACEQKAQRRIKRDRAAMSSSARGKATAPSDRQQQRDPCQTAGNTIEYAFRDRGRRRACPDRVSDANLYIVATTTSGLIRHRFLVTAVLLMVRP